MRLGICSYSFNRTLAGDAHAAEKFIDLSKQLGCTQLDPWNAHLVVVKQGDAQPAGDTLTADEREYLRHIRQYADQAGLPVGCVAIDGAHIYDDKPEARARNRAIAYRWIEAASLLGATQVRIDTGGPTQLTDDILAVLVEGYNDVIARARPRKIQVLVENHWGVSHVPGNLVRLFDAVPDLGLLFDSFNWAYTQQGIGWLTCAKYAKATHIKAFQFSDDGEELTQNVGHCIALLQKENFRGPWVVESCPTHIDETEAAKKTIALIRKYVK